MENRTMKLTPEQKFLWALADTYSGRNVGHDLMFHASQEYLASLEQNQTEEAKQEPEWMPEVGKLQE